VACTPCPPGKDQDKGEGGPYPPSPRLLEGILVPLVWVHLCVYLDSAQYTEGFSILYRSGE
jgi:hypothetical protein